MHTPLQLTVQELETARNGYAGWATFALRDSTTNVCIAVVGEVDRYDSSNNKARAETIVKAVNSYAAMKEALGQLVTLIESKALVYDNDPRITNARHALALAEGKE